MAIDIVRISCNDMKLDDITVTSQSNNPKIPIITVTEKPQHSIGNITHLIFLNEIISVKSIKIKTPIPKTFKSFFIKIIRSSAIKGTPPSMIFALFLYFFTISRSLLMSL
jgi:hypothetical protein